MQLAITGPHLVSLIQETQFALAMAELIEIT